MKKTIIAIIIVLLSVLILTNPSKSKFLDYVYPQAARYFDREISAALGRNSLVSPSIDEVRSIAWHTFVQRIYEKNYLIFTVFEIDSTEERATNPDFQEIIFLGIFGQIIRVNLSEWKNLTNVKSGRRYL